MTTTDQEIYFREVANADGDRLLRLSEVEALVAEAVREHKACARKEFAVELAATFELMRPADGGLEAEIMSRTFEAAARTALSLVGEPKAVAVHG